MRKSDPDVVNIIKTLVNNTELADDDDDDC